MTSAVESADILLTILLAAVLLTGVFTGAMVLLRLATRRFLDQSESQHDSDGALVGRVLDGEQQPPDQLQLDQTIWPHQQRVSRQHSTQDKEFADVHRRARMAMHEAAGHGWRNIAE